MLACFSLCKLYVWENTSSWIILSLPSSHSLDIAAPLLWWNPRISLQRLSFGIHLQAVPKSDNSERLLGWLAFMMQRDIESEAKGSLHSHSFIHSFIWKEKLVPFSWNSDVNIFSKTGVHNASTVRWTCNFLSSTIPERHRLISMVE